MQYGRGFSTKMMQKIKSPGFDGWLY